LPCGIVFLGLDRFNNKNMELDKLIKAIDKKSFGGDLDELLGGNEENEEEELVQSPKDEDNFYQE